MLAPIVALIPQILAAIPIGQSMIVATINWINSIRTAAQQSGEWTPEAEAAFAAWAVKTLTDPKWLTDAEKAAQAS